MFVVIQWIKKNLYLLFAFILFGFAFNQILRFQIYQHSFYFNSSTSFFRTIDLWKSNFVNYFHLSEENESLKLENLQLRNQLIKNITKTNVDDIKSLETTFFSKSLYWFSKLSFLFYSPIYVRMSFKSIDFYFCS